MKFKRIVASLISLAMILTMIPVTSYAQLTTGASGTKAKVEMVLLKKNDSGVFEEVSTDDIDKTVGSVFYVGIKTKDFGNIHEVANYNSIKKGPVTKVTEFGLNTINFTIAFNGEYVILEPENTYWDDASGDYNFAVVKTKPYDSANYYYDYVKADIQTELKNRLALPTGTDATTLINKNFNGSSYSLYDTDQLSLNSNLTSEDTTTGYTQAATITAESSNTAASFPWSGADSTYMAILQFGFIKDATALSSKSIVGFAHSPSGVSYNTLSFGLDSGDAATTYKVVYEDKNDETATGGPEVSPQDIRTIIEFVDAPLFPAGAATQSGISTKSDNSLKDKQFTGKAFDKTGISLQFDYTDGTTHRNLAADDAKVKYYYTTKDAAVADVTAAKALTPVPATFAAGDKGEKDIYAVYDEKWFTKVGTTNVKDKEVSKINSITSTITNGWSGEAVQIPGGFKVNVTYDSGDTADITGTTNLASSGLAVYAVSGGNLTTTLGNYSTPANGSVADATDTFWVAATGRSDAPTAGDMCKSFTVTVKYDQTFASMSGGTAPKLKYNVGDTVDTTGFKAKFARTSQPTGQLKTYGVDFPSAATVVIAADEATAKGSSAKAITAALDASDIGTGNNGKYIWIVVDNNGVKTATQVGRLQPKAGDDYAVNGTLALKKAGATITDAEKTYGNAKLDLASVTVKVTNDDDSSRNRTINLTDADVTSLSIVTKGATPAADTELATSVNANTLIKPAWDNAFLKIVVTGASAPFYVDIPTVTKKALTIAYTGTVADRPYGWDASSKVDTSATGVTAAWTANQAVGSDTLPTVPTVTYSYADGNAATTAKPVLATYAALNDANYSLAAGSAVDTGITGKIIPKEVNPTLVVTVGQNTSQSGDYDLAGKNLTASVTGTSPFRTGDTVTINMTGGTIAEGIIQNPGTPNTGKTITSPTATLGGAQGGNYTLATPLNVTATVSNLPIATALKSEAEINNAIAAWANATAASANNTEAKLITDKAGLPTTGKVTVDGHDYDVDIAWTVDKEYNPKGDTYTYTGKVTAHNNPADVIINLATPLTRQVTITPVSFTKPDVTVSATATVGDTVTLPENAEVTVNSVKYTIPITWSPASVDTSAPADITVTGTLGYATASPAIPNWVTLPTANDAVDNTITKTITVSAEAIPKATSIKADDPDNIKALNIFNNGLTFKASDKANTDDNTTTPFEALMKELPTELTVLDENGAEKKVTIEWTTTDTYDAKGGEYTFTPALKVPDGVKLDLTGFAPAEIKDVKIKVESVTMTAPTITIPSVRQGGTFAPVTSGSITVDGVSVPYTVTYSPDVTTLDTATVGDTSVTVTITPDATVLAANPWITPDSTDWSTDKWTKTAKATVTKKSSGGGGGSSTYTVKFNAGKNGKFDKDKTTVNVSVTPNTKLAATKVPSVEAAEGYKFIGWSTDGKTVVNPTAEAVKKAVTYTALYEEIKTTPAPTDKPLINDKYTKPYASGYDDGMFLPDDYITRAELASMIARLINGDDISDSYKASFPDVDDTWYNKYIGYLEDKNVLSGYEDGTFRPNQTVTRGEMCAIIARAQRYALVPIEGLFSDVTEADWAKDYITTLAGKNIVSGYEDGTFGTYSPITRAETVVIINRVLEPSTPVITFTPTDIAGHWAEADILLAVNERKINGTEVTPEATPEVTPEATPEVTPEASPEVTPEASPEASPAPSATPAA